ncbi:MAG TPA: HisA/HisF-related TIM barrel protein [Anaerolineaceae bacterium]|nr:HisA/HisF-related TIM barrel protein [Anaerolineaceae bacterium]
MRVIPVIDLKNGLAVHAIHGERERYQPVKNSFSAMGNPLEIASAFHDRYGCAELYIADLDAIEERGQKNLKLVSKIASQTGLQILLDAGTADLARAHEQLSCGARKIIIGAETLQEWNVLDEFRKAIPGERLVFSLDMHNGQIMTRCSDLAGMQPLDLLDRLTQSGWSEVILLDLARVGSQAGLDRSLIAEALRRFPDVQLIAGGGVRAVGELEELKRTGVAGVLLATALYNETITAEEIRRIARG